MNDETVSNENVSEPRKPKFPHRFALVRDPRHTETFNGKYLGPFPVKAFDGTVLDLEVAPGRIQKVNVDRCKPFNIPRRWYRGVRSGTIRLSVIKTKVVLS